MAKKYHSTLKYLIAMLKIYGIKNIVSSPGAQNARFNSLIQNDTDFNSYSVVDERSAAYVATGIAHEIKKPVVITCTGATASRNYLSALTEAFYREIPIIAVTFFNPDTNKFTLSPQYVDRAITQNDIKHISVELPLIDTPRDIKNCLLALNASLGKAVYLNQPVHINCPAYNDFEDTDDSLPTDIWKTEYYFDDFENIKNEMHNKKIAIFIGSHKNFSQQEQAYISEFVKSWNMPVFCDHTSHYFGENKILVAQAVNMLRLANNKPDIIIDIGGICGEYSSTTLFKNTDIWRISQEQTPKSRFGGKVTKIFYCPEKNFFKTLKNKSVEDNNYYKDIANKVNSIKVPALPLCSALICKELSENIPQNSSLHLAILNALRNMNFFKLDNSIDVNCNVGGFGIDGPLSTIVGQSYANKNKKFYALVGDLAFFYDMNALGLRDISKNLRILLLNNNGGIEFRLGGKIEDTLGEDAGKLIASSNHYKNGAADWTKSCNFHYMSAKNKQDFQKQIRDFCTAEFEKPVLFEVFCSIKDEQEGLKTMRTHNRDLLEEGLIKIYKTFKR